MKCIRIITLFFSTSILLSACKKEISEEAPYNYSSKYAGSYEITGIKSWFNDLDSGSEPEIRNLTFSVSNGTASGTLYWNDKGVLLEVDSFGFFNDDVQGNYTKIQFKNDSIYFEGYDNSAPGGWCKFEGNGKK